MYTKKELAYAADIIRRIARENHVSEAQVRADMLTAMTIGRANKDPLIQAQWAEFRFAGAEPTVEEFILWTAEKIKQPVIRH